MRILRDYFLAEFISPFFLALGVLTFVMLLGNLLKVTDLIINKGVDIFSVAKLFLLMIPYLLTYTLPIAALAATLISLGRLSGDNEIVAVKACGINMLRLLSPLLTVGTALSLILVIFNDRVIPYAHYATRKTLMEVGVKNPAAALEPGVFINAFEKYVLFIYHIEGNKLANIRIYEPQEEGPTRTIVAKKGEFILIPEKKTVKLKLMDGTADEPDPDNPANFYKLNFKTYFMSLNLAQQETGEINKKPKDMTLQELSREALRLKKDKIDPAPIITEIHKKISLAFSCLIFILLGSSIAVITRRREKSINFGIAFLIVGLYYLMFIGAEALSLQGVLTPAFVMWLPNIIMGITGLLLFKKVCA